MKNKNNIYVFFCLLIIILISLIFLFKYSTKNIDENILSVKWYNYDVSNGYYNIFYIDEENFQYSTAKDNDTYSKCDKYSYNKKGKTLSLNCNKKIDIMEINNDNIILNIDSKKRVFFKNIDDSLNYEFKNYYGKTMSEYRQEKSQVKDVIKISVTRMIEIINNEENATFVFMGDGCSSVDCVLIYKELEHQYSDGKSIYYVDIDGSTDSELQSLLKISDKYIIDKEYYNNIYPIILKVNKEEIKYNEYRCNGFDCNSI